MDILQLQNKNIVIMGVANERSIGWGIAKQLFAVGANVIFTYRKDRSKVKLEKALEKFNFSAQAIIQCDVNDSDSVQQAFNEIQQQVGVVHGLVHSIAFAHQQDLHNDFVETTRDGFAFALDSSAYSLVTVANHVRPLMTEGGAILTMSYLGAERVLDGYNIMGVAKAALESSVRYLANDLGPDAIRVNAISAGAVRTLSAKGVPAFNDILKKVEETAPLKRNITQEEVANMSLAMLSALSTGVTGEIIYVDGGYHIMGV